MKNSSDKDYKRSYTRGELQVVEHILASDIPKGARKTLEAERDKLLQRLENLK